MTYIQLNDDEQDTAFFQKGMFVLLECVNKITSISEHNLMQLVLTWLHHQLRKRDECLREPV